MRAVLIDAVEKTVTEVEYDGELETAYRLLRCDLVEAVDAGPEIDMYVDEEGLLKDDSPFFVLSNGSVFAGSGLITGKPDKNGDSTATDIPTEWIERHVKFTTREELLKVGVDPQPEFWFLEGGSDE
jgi:hypothetical protein